MESVRKNRSIKKFTYRGKDIDALLALSNEQMVDLFPAR